MPLDGSLGSPLWLTCNGEALSVEPWLLGVLKNAWRFEKLQELWVGVWEVLFIIETLCDNSLSTLSMMIACLSGFLFVNVTIFLGVIPQWQGQYDLLMSDWETQCLRSTMCGILIPNKGSGVLESIESLSHELGFCVCWLLLHNKSQPVNLLLNNFYNNLLIIIINIRTIFLFQESMIAW